MTYFFETNIKELKKELSGLQIKNTAEYNLILRKIITIMKRYKLPKVNNLIHKREIKEIFRSAPLSEKTVWGGVTLKKVDVEKDFIQKLLVVNKLGILGFEIHNFKHEKLRILEGVCLVLYSNHHHNDWKKGRVSIKLGFINDKFEFYPKDEHGIIALTDCVIEETSTNHLDDLVYIFPSQQVR